MKVNYYKSECSPELNTRIMRAIERMVCDYHESLSNGWRCCIEFKWNTADEAPYYQLDVESDEGGGEFAPIKMQMLHTFPELCATGTMSLPMIATKLASSEECSDDFFERIAYLDDIRKLTDDDWARLKKFGITHWYGGIRIPYIILVTIQDEESSESYVQRVEGEIILSFSGAKEWQDVFFCFKLFKKIQSILNELWSDKQIKYDLSALKAYPILGFWVHEIHIKEAL